MKDLKIYIAIASFLLIAYLVTEFNQPKPVRWTPTYSKDDKIPFGTYILYNNIHDIFPKDSVETFREPVYNVINDHNIQKAMYIIICGNIDLNDYDINKMIPFIKNGNDVFIAAQWFGDALSKKLKIETDENYDSKAPADRIHFLNKQFAPNTKYLLTREQSDFYFTKIDTAHAISLAQNDSLKSTFVKYNFGKGNLYLNTNPEMFTNYNLIKPAGADYAAKVFSYLKPQKTIIWDEYYTKGREGDESVMRVFFRTPSLKWAYYIAIISFIFFVLFEMKRRQRIIPILEPLQNSTVDFANVVGQVYYEQRNNLNITQKKIVFFLEHLRTQYYLRTNQLDAEFIEKLSHKTGVNPSFAAELVNYITYINTRSTVSDHELIQLNHLIEQFYNQSN